MKRLIFNYRKMVLGMSIVVCLCFTTQNFSVRASEYISISNVTLLANDVTVNMRTAKKEIRTVIKDNINKNSSGVLSLSASNQKKILNLIEKYEDNDTLYTYLLEQLDARYTKLIKSSLRKIKSNSATKITTLVDSLKYLYDSGINIERLNNTYEELLVIEEIVNDIVYAESLKRPSEHLNMDINLDELTTITVYVKQRVKNNLSYLEELVEKDEYSNMYIASDYEYDVWWKEYVPLDKGEIVIETLSSTSVDVGVMEIRVVPDGYVELQSDNGFKKKYPLYRELSDAYIENRKQADDYYNAIKYLPALRELFTECIDGVKSTLKVKGAISLERINRQTVSNKNIVDTVIEAFEQYKADNPDEFNTTTVLDKGAQEQVFGFVEASSELKQEGYNFNAYNLVDDDLTTCWVEGVDGYGENEYIKFYNHLYLPNTISEIRITNGYNAESPEMYKRNSRAKDIEIEFDNGTKLYHTLKDTSNEQVIKLDEPIETGEIKITIRSVYKGTQYDDTCISEITFY